MTEASDKKIIHSYMNVIKKMKNGHRKYEKPEPQNQLQSRKDRDPAEGGIKRKYHLRARKIFIG